MDPVEAIPTSRGLARPLPGVRAHSLILGVVVAGSLLGYGYTTARYGHTFVTVDSYLYYTHAHSWYFDGDLDYENNMRSAPGFRVRDTYVNLTTPSGLVRDVHPCGWSMVALPFLAAADLMTITHNAVRNTALPRDGYSGYYLTIVPLAHVLLGLTGLFVAYVVLARYFSRTIAATATALVWAGTSVIYFVSVEPTASHAGSMAFVTFAVWASDTIRRSGWTWARAIYLGAACSMMTLARYNNIVWVTIPLVMLGPALIRSLYDRRAGSQKQLILGVFSVCVAGVMFIPQILVNWTIEGSVVGSVSNYAPTAWTRPRLDVELIRGTTGLLRLYPLVIVCLAGLAIFLRRDRSSRLPLALALGFAAHVYLLASSYGNDAGYPRRYTCCLVIFAFGMAAMLQWAVRKRRRTMGVALLVGAFCVKNIVLLVLVDQGMVSRRLFNGGRLDLTGVSWATESPCLVNDNEPGTVGLTVPCCPSRMQRPVTPSYFACGVEDRKLIAISILSSRTCLKRSV